MSWCRSSWTWRRMGAFILHYLDSSEAAWQGRGQGMQQMGSDGSELAQLWYWICGYEQVQWLPLLNKTHNKTQTTQTIIKMWVAGLCFSNFGQHMKNKFGKLSYDNDVAILKLKICVYYICFFLLGRLLGILLWVEGCGCDAKSMEFTKGSPRSSHQSFLLAQ